MAETVDENKIPGESSLEILAETFRCFICLEKLCNAHLCPHCSKFCCHDCIEQWLTKHSKCPHCRKSLRLDKVVKCRWMEDVSQQLNTLQEVITTSFLDNNRNRQTSEYSVATSSEDYELPNITSVITAIEDLQLEDQSPDNISTYSIGPRLFAQMLREGKSKPPVTRTSVAKTKDSSASKAVDQTRLPSDEVSVHLRHYFDSDLEEDVYVPAPTFKQSFSDAISQATEEAEGAMGQENASSHDSGKKKKKKQNRKVLFTTRMACLMNK